MPPRKLRCRRREMEELPEPILQHIMSFLDYSDVVRASSVSKAWRTAVSTLQCLSLAVDLNRSVISTNARLKQVESMLYSAVDFMIRATKQKLHVQKFVFKPCDSFSPTLMILVKHLEPSSSKYIREFVFEVGTDGEYSSWKCTLPSSIYSATSLQKLVLSGLNMSLTDIDGISYPSLRDFDLSFAHIGTVLLEQILKHSPQLNIVKISDCFGFETFRVLGPHHSLKRIHLEKNYYLGEEIKLIQIEESPNLEHFWYLGNAKDRLQVLDVAACKNLKNVQLSYICGDGNLVKSIEQLVSGLLFLEVFQLHEFRWIDNNIDQGSKSFRISSNSIRELCLGFVDLGVDVRVDAPRLSRFSYYGFISSTLSRGTPCIEDAVFVRSVKDRIRYDKLVEFLRSFNHIENVKLADFAPRHFKALKRLRHNPDPPLWDIKYLTIGPRYTTNNKYIPINLGVLEGLLWMAPQLQTLSFEDSKSTTTFQFIRESSPNAGMVPYASQNEKFIKVKVGSHQAYREGYEWKKYFFDDGKSLAGKVKPLKVLEIKSRGCGDCAGSIQGLSGKIKGSL